MIRYGRTRERRRFAASAPEHCAEAGQHLVGPEGLRDVVVGSEVQRLDLVRSPDTRREHDDRGPQPCSANLGQHVEAGAIGQAEVEQDRVPSLIGPPPPPVRVSSPRHGPPRAAELPTQRFSQAAVVFDHEQASHAHRVPHEPCRTLTSGLVVQREPRPGRD